MSTIQQHIRAALDTRLAALMPAWPTAWEARTFEPPSTTTPYQRVYLLPATPDNPTLDEKLRVDAGVYQVTMMFPRETDTASIDASTGALQGHFPAGLTLQSGTIGIRIVGTPAIAAGMPAGDRWAVPVSIRYRTINQS